MKTNLLCRIGYHSSCTAIAVPKYFFILFAIFIYEKAKCTAIFWMGRPHSLGNCHFRDVWATCLSQAKQESCGYHF